jgi:formate-dependent nitrite reductase membrane component NrfD
LVAAFTGLVLATYTGVLLGATSVPVWARHHQWLPLHFGTSSLGAAVGIVELAAGFVPPLNLIGLVAAAIETALGLAHEWRRRADDDPDRQHLGSLVRLGHLCSGGVPLILRLAAATSPPLRAVAAVSAIAGSLASRYGWLAAGRRSAVDVYETVVLRQERSG